MVMKKRTLIKIAAVCMIVAGLAAISIAVLKNNEKYSDSNSFFSKYEFKKKKIMSQCQHSLDGDFQWTFYPENNVLGLVALAKVRGQSYDKDVFVFENKEDNPYIFKALKDYTHSGLLADEFNFDRCATVYGFDKGDYFYLMLEYDSIFGEGYSYNCEYDSDKRDITIQIDMKDELGLHMRLINKENIYHSDITSISQTFDSESGNWNDGSAGKMLSRDSDWFGLGLLRVSQNTEGFRDDPEERLRIIHYSFGDTAISRDGYVDTVWLDIGFYGEDSHIDQNSEIRLYYLSGDEYVDVTPEDIRLEDLEYDSDNEHVQRGVITYTIEYKDFELYDNRYGIEDGRYRLDIGSHETYFDKEFLAW